jgi:hypothetical protein
MTVPRYNRGARGTITREDGSFLPAFHFEGGASPVRFAWLAGVRSYFVS